MSAISEKRTAHELHGLEPDNLLAFLALLGALRALVRVQPAWQPRIIWRARPLRCSLVLQEAVRRGDLVDAIEPGIRALGSFHAYDRPDIKFSPDEFRAFASQTATDIDRSRIVAAFASDGCVKRDGETVEVTPLCAMFGQGHQHFLSRLESTVKSEESENKKRIEEALFEPWSYNDRCDGFRWDPIEDRRYALQFGDPSDGKNKIGTSAGANRMAAIGFSHFVSAPAAAGLATVGVFGKRGERDVCWPIVGVPTSLGGCVALLAHKAMGDGANSAELSTYGVLAIARARRFQVGKFFNFERARVQFL